MKRFYSRWLVLLLLLVPLIPLLGSQDSSKNHCVWLVSTTQKIATLKMGMTRADVKKMFEEDGGLTRRTTQTFVHKDCSFIKLDVEFVVVDQKDSRKDQIVSVSKPYLEQPNAD